MRDAFRSILTVPPAPGAPRRTRADWGVIVVFIALGVADEATSGSSETRLAVAVGLSVCVPVALLWRRAWPLLALSLPLAVRVAWGLGENTVGMVLGAEGSLIAVDLTLVVLSYALLRWGSGRAIVAGAALVVLAVVVHLGGMWVTGDSGLLGISVLDAALRWLVPAAAGYAFRVRDEAARARVLDARRSERVGIARELHDTLAHHVTAIAVQAQAARAVAASRPEAAVEALAAIEESASRVLVEMRATVGALRDGGEAERAPARGVADLAELVSGGDGASVEVEVADRLGPLSPTVEAGLFRVAREAVTNAHRHARQAQTITVSLSAEGDEVTLVIADDGKPTRTGTPGFGLVGMRERAELLGGQLSAGPAPEGGWKVTAVLPRNAR
ncbi:MAG: sensor histidine kinase [Bacteroidota bacterium]